MTLFAALALLLFAWASPLVAQESNVLALRARETLADQASGFSLVGLSSSPAVANSIFVHGSSLPGGSTVTFYLDGRPQETENQPPFWFGGETSGTARGFSLVSLPAGTHSLYAVANVPHHAQLTSNTIELNVLTSLNSHFSPDLAVYANQPSAQQDSAAGVLARTSTPGAELTSEEWSVRKRVLAMYMDWGIDPSLDSENDESEVLLSLSPQHWAVSRNQQGSVPLSLLFSPDAPYYQPIPTSWPRVALPAHYLNQLQLNTTQQGDGIGFGEVIAKPEDPGMVVRSEWYDDALTLRRFRFAMPAQWPMSLPAQPAGDMHMIFVDPNSYSFVSSYKTSVDPQTGGPDSLYASSPTALGTLGDRGGSIAAKFAELPAMLQPGEATNPTQPIRHALGGSVARVWAARVYPASAWDGGVRTSVNSCTGTGFTNTGLVPYGGVIQLDPALDLKRLKLTLPAFRILQAIQTYGYYVMDFGCTDLDIYTAISEEELDPFGGLWGYNLKGAGVQNEVQNVLMTHPLYVVAPLTKKQ